MDEVTVAVLILPLVQKYSVLFHQLQTPYVAAEEARQLLQIICFQAFLIYTVPNNIFTVFTIFYS